jgi:phage/plasmid-like protein (TIGR03299 family)
MAHNLTVREDGMTEMFSAGNKPVWHQLGQRTESAVTSAAAIRMAGLDWEVEERHLEVEQGDGNRSLVHSHKAIVRHDNQHLLGVVGSRYQPIQNSEAFEWLDDLVGERRAIFETAGSINGGKVVWMLLELPMELRIEGTDDVTWPYLLVCNSHDGSRAFRVMRTAVRVVCNNTLTWALSAGEGQGLALRHTSGSLDRIDEARKVLGIATIEYQRMQVHINRLAHAPMNDSQARDYFLKVWPNPEPNGHEVDASRAEAVRNRMLEFFSEPEIKAVEGTAWAALNAVTRWTDHERPTRGKSDFARANNRLRSIWFGDSAQVKQRAWREAMALAVAGN